MKEALVVAAHPDDELLGPGAYVASLVDEGYEVQLVVMAEGATSRNLSDQKSIKAVIDLRQACKKAAKVIGFSSVTFLGLPDNQMDSSGLLNVIRALQDGIGNFRPSIVLTHSVSDLNVDHRVTFEAVSTVFRPLPGTPSRRVMAFETLSSTEWWFTGDRFHPNVYVQVSEDHLDRKIKALSLYTGELRDPPHPRSLQNVEALARLRGSVIGVEYAEAFSMIYSAYKFES